MASVNPPRGMRDFLPADKARREHVLAVIRERYRAHGFDEIETPVMEEYGRLHAGIGGDNEKLAYNVLKRGLDAEAIAAAAEDPAQLTDLGLRYDLTVPLARFYATNRGQLPTVFRAIQIAPVWRAERPQKGRYRQFVQCDIDIIGDASSRAESELIVATLDTVEELGLRNAWVRINDRRLLFSMLDRFGVEPESALDVLIILDKLDKIGWRGVVAELESEGYLEVAPRVADYFELHLVSQDNLDLTSIDVPVTESAIERLLPGDDDPSPTERDAIRRLVQIAASVSASESTASGGSTLSPLRFDPFLVRGMGYYTGTIFELAHPSVAYSLGGGGRYDGMIGRFLRQEVPAVGFSIGFERIVDLVDAAPDRGTRAIVLVHDPDVPDSELLAHKSAFVAEGARVRLEHRAKNLTALLDRSAADGYTSFAIVAPGDEVGTLEVKPLA